jgi:hypothetical protein
MALVEIDTLGAFGVVKDEKPYRLDPAVWTEAFNVRGVDGEMHTIGGEAAVFGGTLAIAPYFLIPIKTETSIYWIYTSLAAARVFDGTTHTDITRATGGAYGAVSAASWNGIVFAGIAILNNGVDVPQYWASANPLVKLAALPNWTSGMTAKVVRALGPFLMAFNVIKSGTAYPHMVKWSHPAAPGSVPASWDHTDTTKDAGENDLPDVQAGSIQDAMGLRGQMYVYKSGSTWRIRFIGGRSIFSFDPFLDTSGILTHRCVTTTSDGAQHFIVSQDDVLVHNGNAATSILDKKMRRTLFATIDPDNYAQSFCFTLFEKQEVWFCYPTEGNTVPNRALVWNSKTGVATETDVDFVAASTGELEITGGTWNSVSGTWEDQSDAWSTLQRRKTLVAKPSNSKILQLESGTTRDGTAITGTLQRTGIALLGQKRDKTPIVDFNRRKMITRVWPRAEGGPINVRVGAQDTVEGAVTWTAPVSFNPSVDEFVDLVTHGRAIAIEYSASVPFKLEGHKLDIVPTGEY